LGAYGKLTLEAARTRARRWLELIHSGIDPKRDEEQRRDEAKSESIISRQHTR
jgi:hypothetical protein